jgi:hypothetical protein
MYQRPISREGDCDVMLGIPALTSRVKPRLRLQRPVVVRRNPDCTEPDEAHMECEWKHGITSADVELASSTLVRRRCLKCAMSVTNRQGAPPPDRLDRSPPTSKNRQLSDDAQTHAALDRCGRAPAPSRRRSSELTFDGLLMEA